MDALRLALRRLAKAVVIITSRDDTKRYAMAATAVSELSLDPPSMLICVNTTASLYAPLSGGAPFAINILHHEQQSIAARCFGATKGEARFAEGEWFDADMGLPVLKGAQANILCRNIDKMHHGTHAIFIGEVLEVTLAGVPDPLIYLDGQYTRASAP